MRWRPNLVGWPIILALLFQGRAHLRSAGGRSNKKEALPLFVTTLELFSTPTRLWLCVLPRWQLNVNVNVNTRLTFYLT